MEVQTVKAEEEQSIQEWVRVGDPHEWEGAVAEEAGTESPFIRCLRRFLRPVARYCIRQNMGIQIFEEASKLVFMEVAAEELKAKGEKVNMSRLSAITGIQRRAVVRIFREGEVREPPGLAVRIIGQWRRDKRFLGKNGRARVLTYEGEDCGEFGRLVRCISKELHPRSLLIDLERMGAVERTRDGVKLLSKLFFNDTASTEIYTMLSEDVEDLMEAVFVNAELDAKDRPNIHVKTQYDNVSPEDLGKIRDWFDKQAYRFHQLAERFMAKFDLDVNPKPGKTGGHRVVVGTFTRTT